MLPFPFTSTASAWAVSQHADTSNNIKATLQCCYIMLHSYVGTIFSHTASAGAVSQHADTSNNIKATLKCRYIMLHSYVGTIFSHAASAGAVSQHANTSNNIKAILLLKCCIVMWGLSSFMIRLLQRVSPSRN